MSNLKLDEIIENYENLIKSFRHFTKNSEANRESLIEFQGMFTDLKSSLRVHHNEVMRNWTKRDDKSATAIKYRMAISISKGDMAGFDSCSMSQAEKYAAGCPEYKEFIKQRSFWKESLNNLSSLRDDINSYLIEISNRLR